MSAATLAELAALMGDKELTLRRPLTEGAYAALVETIRTINRAGDRIDALCGECKAAGIPFDASPFHRLRDHLDEAHDTLQPVMLAHINAMERAGL
jgi:hypothetical protein